MSTLNGAHGVSGGHVISLQMGDREVRRDLITDQVSFCKGVTIYHEGDPARHWYEVLSGIVRTCRFLGDGHRQLIGFFYPNDVVGVGGADYGESAEAVTDVVLRRIPARPDAESSTGDRRDLALEKALESARRSIFLFGHRTATKRVAAFLITMAERTGARADVQLPMTRCDIADHLNLTLHTVSRTISDFARKHLIALDSPQHLRILDVEGLRMVSGESDAQGAFHVYSLPPQDGLRLCDNE
jgi:CRP-like cAMP-binding protein